MAALNSLVKIMVKPWLLLVCLIVLFSVLIVSTLKKDENCYYIKINGLKFNNSKDTITFGKNDNVIFGQDYIDTGFLKIIRVDKGFHWETKNPTYIKFNTDSNFNKYDLHENDIIHFKNQSRTFNDVKESLAGYLKSGSKGQHYFAVNDIFMQDKRKVIIADEDLPSLESKSLLYFNEGKFQVILLDSNTTVVSNNSIIKTRTKGFVETDVLTIELINPKSTSFVKDEDPLFSNRNIDVPTVRTEWQSSRILCKLNPDSSISVLFNQPLVIAFNQNTIDEITKRTISRTMQVAQESPLMDKKTFYFEKFSNLFQSPIFNIEKADSVAKQNHIHFNSAAEGKIIVNDLSINQSFDFSITSIIHPDVAAVGNFIYVSKWFLLGPFFGLAFCVIICCFALYFLTHEFRYLYGKKLTSQHSSENNKLDFEFIKSDNTQDCATFWKLRFPILLFVAVLLCFKLVIVTKLVFTHPFFPQFYFIGCFMAFTTPFFITYFFIRNSWARPMLNKTKFFGFIPHTIFFTLSLIAITFLIYYFTWFTIGVKFYKNYFSALDVTSDFLTNFKTLFQISLPKSDAKSPLLEEKFYQIPLLILGLPFILLFYDFITLIPKLQSKMRSVKYWIFNVGMSIDVLLISIAVLAVGSKSTTVVHVTSILLLAVIFNYFSETTIKAEWPSAKKWKEHLNPRIIVGGVLVIVVLVVIFFKKINSDAGIVINYFLIFPFAIFLLMILLFARSFENGIIKKWMKVMIPFGGVLLIICTFSFCFTPKIDDLSRSGRRINSIINKDEALKTGGKQYLSDIQFLEIAQINSYESTKSPSFQLINRDKPLHEFVSKGLYTVIINDLNPIVFLDYGGWVFLLIIFSTWLIFFFNRNSIWKSSFQLSPGDFNQKDFNLAQLFRYLPALIIISNSLWMFLSLFNVVFFTGRIVNGFGVDSISDWFELVAFSALMGIVIFSKQAQSK